MTRVDRVLAALMNCAIDYTTRYVWQEESRKKKLSVRLCKGNSFHGAVLLVVLVFRLDARKFNMGLDNSIRPAHS